MFSGLIELIAFYMCVPVRFWLTTFIYLSTDSTRDSGGWKTARDMVKRTIQHVGTAGAISYIAARVGSPFSSSAGVAWGLIGSRRKGFH